MGRMERVIVYSLLVAACVLSIRGWLATPSSGAAPAWGAIPVGLRSDDPEPARIAVCDSYKIAELMIESPRYAPAIDEKERELRSELEPLQAQMEALRQELQGADPSDEAAQAKAARLQRMEYEFRQFEQRLRAEYQSFAAGKYIEAYRQVMASAEAVATDLGYGYVIASRPVDAEVPGNDLQALLSRPVLARPEGADITADVLDDLNLDE